MGMVVPFAHWLRAGVLAAASVVGVWAPAVQAQPQTPASAQTQPLLPSQSADASVPPTAETQVAVAQSRAQERVHLQQQRQAIGAALQQGEAACYQRFAVEDCLQRERRRARKATALIAQRETALNDAERRERAALRLSDIAERKVPEKFASPDRVRVPEVSADALQQERAFEAQQRAERLQQKQQRHAADKAQQVPQRAAAAEKARQRLEEKRQAAEQRRTRALQAQQERAAAGRKPPAALNPLP